MKWECDIKIAENVRGEGSEEMTCSSVDFGAEGAELLRHRVTYRICVIHLYLRFMIVISWGLNTDVSSEWVSYIGYQKLNNVLKNPVSWDVTLCGSCKDRRSGETYRLHHQGDKNRRARNNVSSKQQQKHAAKETAFFIVTAVRTSNLAMHLSVM
jgi:hypothetical protein